MGVINPVLNFTNLAAQQTIYFEPCVPTTSNNIWQFVDGAGLVSDVRWSQSFNEAVISWLNAKYALPEGYTSFNGGTPSERDAEDMVTSKLDFI